jgi:hypothetical protein
MYRLEILILDSRVPNRAAELHLRVSVHVLRLQCVMNQ